MKLNKLTLQWLVYHALHSDAAGHTELEIIKEIDEALKKGTLEIEGYVRKDHFRDATKMVDEWTKFDPDDPKTFPPIGSFLYLKKYSESTAYSVGHRASGDSDEDFAYRYWEWGMIHWHPLPKLTTETKEK